ncbi:DHH family phosphoesterase [Thermoanaerobacterium sp. DL9XJH110]|uniref:DHH family phosphoesterase n=1 Tax=Thermoanaerobacterium sp. DL9XJH110 TaxID=3386643 RepID=UPI003BB7CBCF
MDMDLELDILSRIIRDNRTFIITSHIMPDGDSVGSLLALALALKKEGKIVFAVINDAIPEKYKFLPGSDDIIRAHVNKCDVVISLDCGDTQRLGFGRALKDLGNIVVNIDHHKSNSFFGDINLVDSKASSAGEIVYRLIKRITRIDYEIALCLYTSIVTDTGSARYSNTTPFSLKILAELVEMGVRPDFVSRRVFETKSLSSIFLLKSALDTLEISGDGKVASMYITKSMMETSGAREEDTDGIINYAREIEGVEVAVLFRETGDFIKVGLRSNEWLDVSKIAEDFGGGGHARASGCILKTSLWEARDAVLKSIIMHLSGESG